MSFFIHCRFFVKEQGWKHEVTEVTGSVEDAAREASRFARVIDGIYGDDHFWTVDLKNESNSSYLQLFHGRLS